MTSPAPPRASRWYYCVDAARQSSRRALFRLHRDPVAKGLGLRDAPSGLKVNISGGEAEFNRWGWRALLESRALDIAQPEVCALGGISEYLRVLALCHAHFTPVVNHVWGSAVAVATNLQLLAAMPSLPGGLHPREPMLEFDTTDNKFRDELLTEPLDIQGQVARSGGFVEIPKGPGLGVEPDRDFIAAYSVDG